MTTEEYKILMLELSEQMNKRVDRPFFKQDSPDRMEKIQRLIREHNRAGIKYPIREVDRLY